MSEKLKDMFTDLEQLVLRALYMSPSFVDSTFALIFEAIRDIKKELKIHEQE